MTGGGSSWNGNGGLLNAGIAAGGLFAPLGVGQALGLGKGIYDQLSYGGDIGNNSGANLLTRNSMLENLINMFGSGGESGAASNAVDPATSQSMGQSGFGTNQPPGLLSRIFGGLFGSSAPGQPSSDPGYTGGQVQVTPQMQPGIPPASGNNDVQYASQPTLDPGYSGGSVNVTPQMQGGFGAGATQSTQPYTYNGMTANLNYDPNMLAAAIADLNKLPSLNYTTNGQTYGGGASGAGWGTNATWSQNGIPQSSVGYAPGADFMSGFGGQGGYEAGGSYPGMRTLVR